MSFTIKNFTSLVTVSIQNNASDIHIRTDEVPCLRIRGELIPIQTKIFSIEDVKDVIKILVKSNDQYYDFTTLTELDGSFALADICRLRFNIFRYYNNFGVAIRIVKNSIPTLAELEMPSIISNISLQGKGLILITGETGTGKSTTLAAMINHINENNSAHIITIEDPIEYLHQHKKSRISQREIRSDTENFASGVKSALRQDPDVISIGEIRNHSIAEVALEAAETGLTVFSTLYTTNVVTTIERIISMFPENEKTEGRKRIAENLHAIIGQRMLKGKDGRPIVAQEIMLINEEIRNCIIGFEDISQISQIIAQSKGTTNNSGQTFDQHIMYLYQNDFITKEEALKAASSTVDFAQNLSTK